MDAGQASFSDLITAASRRFVIPVYQRPYSWDEAQCIQLWEDILSVGRKEQNTHFTGSVVWIQDGTMSANGVTPLLLIDGQQRVTTIMLLLVALASFSKARPNSTYHFSYDEIIDSGYLVNKHKKGEDHYKLTLSQGDRATLRSLIDHLEDSNCLIDESSSRLIDNLDLFTKRLEALEDPNLVWDGIQRLEVVSISLAQGSDNPQLIFESMNSTGKDLSSADLIRNFVLMGQPMEKQEALYKNQWRLIEETLGSDSYDTVFDDFIRNYLTVLYAPEPLTKKDVYPAFKRHVINNGYDKDNGIVELLQEVQRFARYYASVTSGAEKDARLKDAFNNLVRLDTSTLNPLLLSLYDDYENEAFSYEDFLEMLKILDSYVFRRAVCDCASNSFNKFLPSIIARLNKVQDEGGNYKEAFISFLLNEAGSNRRFPTDVEFERALKARDSYHFKKAFHLLSRLENSYHPKDQRDFASGNYTIEHILPQNALAHDDWVRMLGNDYVADFEECINNIGNLTLTAYNSELSDGSFAEKKARSAGGYNNEFISISSDLREADSWNAESVRRRADALIKQAVVVWGMPEIDEAIRLEYAAERKSSTSKRAVAFKELFDAGLVKAGDVLISASPKYPATATVTDKGAIRLTNGTEWNSPSLASIKAVALQGGTGARNGWHFWRLGENGPLIDSLRKEHISGTEGSVTSDLSRFRVMFWDGFYEYCSTLPGFVGAFGDTADRAENTDCWASFGIGIPACNLTAVVLSRESCVGVTINCYEGNPYPQLLAAQPKIESIIAGLEGAIHWDALNENKKSRSMTVKKPADFDNDDWNDLYAWMVSWLWQLKAAVVQVLAE